MANDDDIIEGKAIVVQEPERSLPTKSYQVMIKTRTDAQNRRIKNMVCDVSEVSFATAWPILADFLCENTVRTEVKQIFRLIMDNVKPKRSRKGDRFTYLFESKEGRFIEEYEIVFVEL